MKRAGTILMLATSLALMGACGTSSTVINGNWAASLTNAGTNGSAAFAFDVTLTEMSGGGLSFTNLTFTTTNPCFGAGATATGGFTLSGNQSGVTSGGFQMTIQSVSGVSNVLTLQGTVQNNVITGTWTLSGTTAGCTGSGTFIMNKG